MPTSTPWGAAQTADKVAPGIINYTTASHGGLRLSKDRLAAMPPSWVGVSGYPAGWYEEDCDWALPVLMFPECFTAAWVAYAQGTAERWHADLLADWPDEARQRFEARLKEEDVVTATEEMVARRAERERRMAEARKAAKKAEAAPEVLPVG